MVALSHLNQDRIPLELSSELSQPQDDEFGDCTTETGTLLEQAADLIDKEIHLIRIADVYDQTCDIAF